MGTPGSIATPPTTDRDHAAIAHAYALDVVAGRQLACKWVRLACQRHLNDLARAQAAAAGGAPFGFVFDAEAGARVCRFIELLPHTKGKWAIGRPGQPGSNLIVLEPWQMFFLVVLFGWKHAPETPQAGTRRFRKAYLCVPRKNAKSVIAAGVGLYMLGADGEFGAEVYSGATTEKQAWEVFRPARLMAQRTPRYCEVFGVEVGAKNLHCPDNGSRFEPVIGKPGDGASPSCAIVDEYHEHDTDELLDTMVTGMGAREQPIALIITTAGTNIEAPCYALQLEVQGMLDGTLPNDELFGIIYTIDEGDDWTSDLALRKANPNFDVSVFGPYLRARVEEAVRTPRRQAIIKTKHLNLWCNARDPWLDVEAWQQLHDAPPLASHAGDPCWMALDLSSKIDLTADAKVFRREVDGVTHYDVYIRAYLPEEAASAPEKAHYGGWVQTGDLRTTEGNVVDYDVVKDEVLADAEAFDVRAIAFDPWNATQLATQLGKEGLPLVEVGQTTKNLSDPMKEIEALVKAKRIHHDGNAVLTWAVSNVVVKEDANENVFPRKQRPEGKIDPAVAMIMAVGRALADAGDPDSVYDERELREL